MKVIFLDDEDFLFPLMERYFKMLNIEEYFCTTSPDKTLELLNDNKFDCLLIDYNIPDIDDINKYVKKIKNKINIVIVSGEDNKYIEANIDFDYLFLKKPFVIDDLKKILSI